MKKKWFCLTICIFLVLNIVACKGNSSQEISLSNADFSRIRNDGTPIDWTVKSYEEQYEINVVDGVVTMSSDIADDLRIYQSVGVSENTKYIVTAEIRTENVESGRGASVSIDNYSIDGSCVYSYVSLLGTNDWQQVELAFETVEGQTEVLVALRLGGYSEASSGTVQFRNVEIVQSAASSLAYQQLNPWTSSSETSTSGEKTADEYIAFFAIIQLATVFAALFLIGGFYKNRERIYSINLNKRNLRITFAAIIFAGLIIRILLCARYRGHPSDLACWVGWGSTVANEGVGHLYATSWCDYPPGYLWVSAILSKICSILGLSVDTTAGLFVYMIPPFLADIGIAFTAMVLCDKCKRSAGFKAFIFAFIIFNPAIMFLSGAWSQTDSILTVFLLLSFLYLLDNKRIIAALFYAIAIIFKWQALVFGPVLACVYLLSIRSKKDIIRTIAAVGSALALVFAVFLIAMPQGESPFYFIERFSSASTGYQYASIEAYNFMALLKGNWTALDSALGGTGITYRTIGTIALVLSLLATGGASVFLWYKQKAQRLNLIYDKTNVFLISAFSMFSIFTFVYYMHERYVVPVIFFILFAYICSRDKRLLLCTIFLTVTTFMNEMVAMYVMVPPATDAVRGGVVHNDMIRLCSFMEVAVFVYFTYVAQGLLFARKLNVKYLEELSDEK